MHFCVDSVYAINMLQDNFYELSNDRIPMETNCAPLIAYLCFYPVMI